MASSVKVSGVWKNTPTYNVKVNGVWKPATNAYVKINGVWKQYFTAGGGSTGPGPVTGVPVINSSPSLSLGYDGVTMQVAAGSWLGGVDTYSYEWFINGSSTSAYGPTQSATAGLIGSSGAQYYVKVTATNTSGSTTAVSNTIGLPAKATAAAPAAVVVSAPATPSVSLGYSDVPSVWSSTGSNWTTEGYITLQWNYFNVNTSGITVSFGGQGDIAAHAAITSPTTADVHSPYNVTGTVFVIVTFPNGTNIRSNEIAYTNLHQQVTAPVVPTVVTPPSGGGGGGGAPATVTLYQYTTTVQGNSGNISGSGATGQTVSIPASVYATGDPNLIQAAIIAAGGTIVAYNPNIGTGIPATGVTTTTNYSTSSTLTGSAATSVTGLPGAYVPPTTITTSQNTPPTVNGGNSGGTSSGSTTITPASPTTIPGATSSTATSGGYSGIPTTTTTTSTSTAILPFSNGSTGSKTTTATIAPGITVTTTVSTTGAYVGSTLQSVQTTKTTTTTVSTASTSTKGGCFLFGTPVLKADGSWINIEQLQPGDELVSVILPGLPENEEGWDWLDNWSMKNLENIEKTTTVVLTVNRRSYWKYYIINGTIKVTLEHRVLVKQGGVWRFNEIEYVNIGDSILDENLNEIVIKGKKEVQDEVAVVDIDTEVKDTYFVKGMLAHNMAGASKQQYL